MQVSQWCLEMFFTILSKIRAKTSELMKRKLNFLARGKEKGKKKKTVEMDSPKRLKKRVCGEKNQ